MCIYCILAETSGENDALNMADGQSFFILVRATNIMGMSFLQRSNGITVQLKPLVPGSVFDGPLEGFDLNYQTPTDKLWANWQGFGRSQEKEGGFEHTGACVVLLCSLKILTKVVCCLFHQHLNLITGHWQFTHFKCIDNHCKWVTKFV